MSEPGRNPHISEVGDTPGDEREAYEPPSIVWEEALDVKSLAVACGKGNPGTPGCGDIGPPLNS